MAGRQGDGSIADLPDPLRGGRRAAVRPRARRRWLQKSWPGLVAGALIGLIGYLALGLLFMRALNLASVRRSAIPPSCSGSAAIC